MGKTLKNRQKLILVFVVPLVAIALISGLSMTFKVEGVTIGNLLQADDPLTHYTLWHIRAPRLALAFVLGAALATAGCLLQALTRNSLADPEIIGINQGASCFAVLAIMLFGERQSSTVLLSGAFVGAAVVAVMLFTISRYGGRNPSRFLLAGVALGAFMGSLTTSMILFQETQLSEVLYWMAGKLSGADWLDNQLAWFFGVPAIVIALLLANTINVLLQGEEIAQGLGVNITRMQRVIGLVIVLITGGAVAVAGPIGFIGLMVPHITKRVVGNNHRVVVPLAALIGAGLLAAADLTAQWLFYPSEIPVGIITAFLGVPFFLYLLRRNGGEVK